jgi:sugar lactone lactonase YvrE
MPAPRRLVPLVCALALGALAPAAARAESVESVAGLASNANGVTAGADGNLYVVEPGVQKVAVFTPDGRLIRQVDLGGAMNSAASAAPGPDGNVWVSISGAGADRGFAVIAPSGAVTRRSTATVYACGPVGLAAGTPGRMIFTAPTGICGGTHGLSGLNADPANPDPDPVVTLNAFDLAFYQGKSYVPDFDADELTRWGMQGGSGYFGMKEAVIGLPAGGGPDGIEVGPGGNVFVTLFNTGQVARVPATAPSGTVPRIVASGLVDPFGLAAGSDGAVYVASQDARVVRIGPDDSQRSIALPAGMHPWQVAALGNDIWVTDNTAPTLVRIRNAGRAEPAPPAAPAPAPTPPATPAPVPTPIAAPKKPKVADVVSLAATTKCLSRRRLTLTVRKRKTGAKVSSIKVAVGKGKAKTYTAKKLKVPVTLTGLPKGTFKVRLTIRLTDGTTLTQTRTYKTCAPKKATKRK